MTARARIDNMNNAVAPITAVSPAPAPSPGESRSYICKNYSSKLVANIGLLRLGSKFCDVELISGDTVIKTHRLVLSAGSAYFSAMFGGGLAEEKRPSVHLPAIPPSALPLVVNFIYTGQVEISHNTVQEVLVAADMLQLRDLVEGCSEFLIRELHPSNAVGIYMFAEAHNCAELMRAALEHVQCNFSAVSAGDEILELPAHHLSTLLSSDYLRVDSESQVLEAALRWVEYRPTERRRHIFEVLAAVRLAVLGASAIDRALSQCSDNSLRVALKNHRADLVSRKGALVSLNASPRTKARKKVLIFGGSCRETPCGGQRTTETIFNSVLQFDLHNWEWKELCPMSTGRILPGVACLGGSVYVIGGEQESQILANGEIYDPLKDTWTSIAPMNVPRCEFGLTAWRGALYALGGWIGEDMGSSVECYDPATGCWINEGSMPEPRFSMGVVTYDGLIYLVGGCNHLERHLNDMLSFNPVTREWRTLAPMKVARSQAGVAVLDGYLYAVGGNSKTQEVLSSVEKYSFDEDKWSKVCCMSVGRASPSVAAVEGLLLVAGGDQEYKGSFFKARATTDSAELYDPRDDQWYAAPPLPQSRSEAGTAVL